MGISSFSLLNTEETSNFFNFSQDFDEDSYFGNSKRRRTGDYGEEIGDGIELLKSSSFKEVLSALLFMDEGEKSIDEKWEFETVQQNPVYNQEDGAMDFSNFQDNVLTGNDKPRVKRSRRVAAAAAPASTSFDSSPVVDYNQSAAASSCGQQQQRRLWVKDRSKAWWEHCNSPDFPEEEFRRAFRMSRATFDLICEELDSAVTKKDTMLRQAIPVRQRVAVCIWRLATGEPLRLVSKRFGLGISTCHKLVLEVCTAIRDVLMPKFVQWPDEPTLNEIKNQFESVSGIPNVGGSIYTTHIPIIAPKVSVAAYFNKRHTERNQKTSYSITVQGVVDPKGVFTDVCIGWPGSMADDKVLEKSTLYQRANRGQLKNTWVVGNSGFPLMDWILAPYTHQNLTWTQHAFNEKIEEVQSVAKAAFMRLKGRWTCLQKRTEVKLQDLPVVLGACCVLHNICEMRGEEMDEELKFVLFDDEMVAENGVRSVNSVKARDHIAHNLLHRNHAGTAFL